jgi:hypothetical protein
VQTLLQHYGRKAAVGVGEIGAQALTRFGVMERAAGTYDVPEFAYAHRALISFVSNGRQQSSQTEDILDQVADLSDEDREIVWQFWSDYATQRWARLRSPESGALSELTMAFLKIYRSKLNSMNFAGVDDVIRTSRLVRLDDLHQKKRITEKEYQDGKANVAAGR